MDLKQTAKRMARFAQFNVVLNDVLKSLESDILDLNRDQMYEDGVMDVNNPGSILRYAPSTIVQKKRRAKFPRTDHITLKWEGEFHKGLKIKYDKDSFTIFSEDRKWKAWLEPQERFENALGLTDDSLALMRDWVADELIKRFKKTIA